LVDIGVDVGPGIAFVGVQTGGTTESFWVCVATDSFALSLGVDFDVATTLPAQVDAESSLCFGSSASNCIKLFEDTGVIVSVSGTVVTVTIELDGAPTPLSAGLTGTLAPAVTFFTFPVCVGTCVNVVDPTRPIVVKTGLSVLTPAGSVPLCLLWMTSSGC